MGGALAGAAMTLGGSVASLTGGVSAANAASAAVDTGAKLIKLVQGADQVIDGVQQIHAADLQHDADKLQIGAKQKQQILDAIARTVDALVEDLKNKEAQATKTMSICASMSETLNQTTLSAGAMRG